MNDFQSTDVQNVISKNVINLIEMEEKRKVSAFEYAIAEAANDTKFLESHSPRTREEENEHRVNSIKNQLLKR